MFQDLTKIQINPETLHVHLAIKISDNHVHNLIFTLLEFIEFNLSSVKKWGNEHWDLQKLGHHVKLCSRDYSTHYRFSNEQWQIIKQQFVVELEKHDLHITK